MKRMKTAVMIVASFSLIACITQPPTVMAHDGVDHKAEKKIAEGLAGLSASDKKVATTQRFCPMMPHSRLGAMGEPIKLMIEGNAVFVCCKGCVEDAKKGEKKTVKTAQKLTEASATLAKLPSKEQAAAEAQKFCAVANSSFLGSMGAPIKLEMNGKSVYLCCEGCEGRAKADPAATLAKVEKLKKAGMKKGHSNTGHERVQSKQEQ